MIDEFFIVLLLIGLGVIILGCILFFILEILERKQEIKDFKKQSQLNNSFNKAKEIRKNKKRTFDIHLN